MKYIYIRIVTILGLVTILSMQYLWLYNTYELVKTEISIKASDLLEKATIQEMFLRIKTFPKGTEISGKPLEGKEKDKDIPENAYMQESLSKMGSTVSMKDLYGIYSTMLIKAGLKNDVLIYQLKNKKIITNQFGTNASSTFDIKTHQVPVRPDSSLVIQAELVNPNELFFSKMGLLLLSTAIMMCFVIGCIIYQIKIITKQNKIAQIREDFSYAMIHDMKTPLSSIMMCANFLHSGKLDSKPEIKEKYFTIVENEAIHLLNLTNKVLTLSKLESNKLEMSKSTFLLAPIIDNLIEKFVTKSTKKVYIETDLQAKEVYADEEFLKEAISNLIDNAIKYSNESVKIKISSLSNDLYTIIKVHDNGIGISDEDQKTIFNKFERASATQRTKSGGATGFGLGLNYVYKVIEAHNGKVFVNSIEGEFSEFIMYLPLTMKEL